MLTYMKVGSPINDPAFGYIVDGWKHCAIIDPSTNAAPTDGHGREILWVEIDTAGGWGVALDQDNLDEDVLKRIEAPWVRLLRIDLRLPISAYDFLC